MAAYFISFLMFTFYNQHFMFPILVVMVLGDRNIRWHVTRVVNICGMYGRRHKHTVTVHSLASWQSKDFIVILHHLLINSRLWCHTPPLLALLGVDLAMAQRQKRRIFNFAGIRDVWRCRHPHWSRIPICVGKPNASSDRWNIGHLCVFFEDWFGRLCLEGVKARLPPVYQCHFVGS